MKEKKHNILKKLLKIISYFIIIILCLFVLLIIFYLISSKLNNREDYKPKISMYTIVSPSMTPVIKVYDVVVNIRPNKADDIQIGDIITYISRDPNSSGMTITHRVIEISHDSEGNKEFLTQGDNNNDPDPLYVPFKDIVGVEIAIIPYLGKAQFLLLDHKNLLIILLIPIIIYLLIDIFKLNNLFHLKNKVDKISSKVKSKEDKKILEQARKEQIINNLEEKNIKKDSRIRSIKEPSGFLDEYNETIITVKENKYNIERPNQNEKVSLNLSPKSKKELYNTKLTPVKEQNNEEKQILNNRINEYNTKLEQLNKMLREIENIQAKNEKKTKEEEAKELLHEEFLKDDKIKVVKITTTKEYKNAILLAKELKEKELKKEEIKTEEVKKQKLNLNPKDIKKINRQNKTGTLKKTNSNSNNNNHHQIKNKPHKKRTPFIRIVKK